MIPINLKQGEDIKDIYNPRWIEGKLYMNINNFLYVDDTLIPSESFKDCIFNLKYIGDRLIGIGSRFKPPKTMYKAFNYFYLKKDEYIKYINNKIEFKLYGNPLNNFFRI